MNLGTLPQVTLPVSPTPSAAPGAQRKAAGEFEAMFIGEMLAPIFQGLGRDKLFGSAGEEIFRSLLVQEYGKALSGRGGLGLSDRLTQELLNAEKAR